MCILPPASALNPGEACHVCGKLCCDGLLSHGMTPSSLIQEIQPRLSLTAKTFWPTPLQLAGLTTWNMTAFVEICKILNTNTIFNQGKGKNKA